LRVSLFVSEHGTMCRMEIKEYFGKAWTLRSYLLSPWKLLFYKKVFYGLIIFGLSYWVLPPSVTKYADYVISPVWRLTRAIAAEIGIISLAKHGVTGVSKSVEFFQGPDEIENSQGGDYFYAGNPIKTNLEWAAGSSGNLQFKQLDLPNKKGLAYAYKLDTSFYVNYDRSSFHLAPFKKSAHVGVDKRDMKLKWQELLNKLELDLESFDVLWCVSGIYYEEEGFVGGLFMLVTDEYRQQIRTQAFVVPRFAKPKDKPSTYLITVDELEALVGLDFMNQLAEEEQIKLETSKLDWAW